MVDVAGQSNGGEGGIRTPDTVARTPHFECGAFNHSATSPSHCIIDGFWFLARGKTADGRENGRQHLFRTPRYHKPKRRVESRRRIALHRVGDVRI